MDPRIRTTYDDCFMLLDDFVDALVRFLNTLSLGAVGSAKEDVLTWLSIARTDHDTCLEDFVDAASPVKGMSKFIRNCLVIFSAMANDEDFVDVPIRNRRPLMMPADNFSRWFNRRDRRLLNLPLSAIQVDIVVSKDSSRTIKTITNAIKKVKK